MSEQRRQSIVFVLAGIASILSAWETIRLPGMNAPRVAMAVIAIGWISIATRAWISLTKE